MISVQLPVGRISVEDHYALAEDFFALFMSDTGPYVRGLEKQMQAAAQSWTMSELRVCVTILLHQKR